MSGEDYKLLGVDLSELSELERALEGAGLDSGAPTLFIAEVVLTYMENSRLVQSVSEMRTSCFVCMSPGDFPLVTRTAGHPWKSQSAPGSTISAAWRPEGEEEAAANPPRKGLSFCSSHPRSSLHGWGKDVHGSPAQGSLCVLPLPGCLHNVLNGVARRCIAFAVCQLGPQLFNVLCSTCPAGRTP